MPRTRTSVRYSPSGFNADEDPYFRASEEAFRRAGLSLTRVAPPAADVIIFKTFEPEMRRLYPSAARSGLSVTDRGKSPMEIHINGENWTRIPKHLGSEYTSLRAYRIALLSHEFAHAFGHDHVGCACAGCKSDVRQQPSRGLGGCVPTTEVVFHANAPHSNVNF